LKVQVAQSAGQVPEKKQSEMSRNQTLVIDVKVVHREEMSFEKFIEFCVGLKGLDVAEATKRWDRIFKTYNDGKFEVDDVNSYEVSETTFHSCEDLAQERVECLIEEFEDAEPEAPKEAPNVSKTLKSKWDKYTAEDEPEDFFAGKTFPANTEFVLPV
jgi:hypothetical protein